MFKTSKQALKSYFAYAYTDLKKTVTIGIAICSGVFVMQMIITLIVALVDGGGNTSSNGGMLITGFGIMLITFMIGVFVDTANGHMRNLFRFPINRPTYAIGNLINILIAPLAIVTVVSIFQILEVFTYALFAALFENFVYINTVTIMSYLEGILPTYATVVATLSFVYMLSMYFHRYKFPFTLGLVMLIFALIFIGDVRLFIVRLFAFPYNIQTILPYSLYLLGVSVVFHVIAFLPLKLMEVKS